jgi:hypothetical protein
MANSDSRHGLLTEVQARSRFVSKQPVTSEPPEPPPQLLTTGPCSYVEFVGFHDIQPIG